MRLIRKREHKKSIMTVVLVAIDPLMYREVIVHAVRERRPHAEVHAGEPENLDREARRLTPDLIVCNHATVAVRESAKSWLELEVRLGPGSLDANIKVDSRPLSKVKWAEIDDVVAALDETEKALRRA